MAKNSAAGLLTSVDSMFTTQEERDNAQRSYLTDIPAAEISDFPNHPFHVRMDEEMERLVDSVKERGVLSPVLVRPMPDGGYQMVSGHRRKRAAELAELPTLSCIVRELTDDEATIIMVDSNLQREKVLPSEKAFAYKMKLDAMKRQGQRVDLTCATPLHKLNGKKSRDVLAEQSGESHEQIRKYIRLTNLIPPLLDIKEHGLEKPIILREGTNGDFQLVDGFHRCEAMKRAGFLEVKAEVYDMTPLEASRYRREHRNNPDLPIPGKLIPAHPPKEEPAVEADAPDQDEEIFEIPKNFTLPITKPGQAEIITTLKVADIHPFEGHPFLVKDNKDMFDLVESVKLYGVLEPVMVINRPAGGYEMVSGHRRMRACQLAGIETIPTIVRNLDRDEAIIAMVDANLKREEITPMEKARAYKMKTEAMRRKVGRRSKAEAAAGEKPLSADEELAKQVGESVATVQRYKQLNQLEPELQEMVDKGKIPVNTAADIALLKKDEQKELVDAIQREDKVPTGAQAKEMKKQSKEGTLTTEAIKQSVAPTKREETPPLKITLVEEDLRPYFPDKRTTTPDVKKGIFEALALRQKLQERQKAKAQQPVEPKNETKPPDTPTAGGDQKPTPPVSGPADKPPASKTPPPKTGGTKKPTPGKKPAKPQKNNPAR